MNTLIDEIYPESLNKNYGTNKTILLAIDETWSLGLSNLTEYGSGKIEVID